jgi:hypothetical protein
MESAQLPINGCTGTREMKYMYTMKFYSDVMKKEIMLFVRKWMKLNIIMLSEISQSHKDKH